MSVDTKFWEKQYRWSRLHQEYERNHPNPQIDHRSIFPMRSFGGRMTIERQTPSNFPQTIKKTKILIDRSHENITLSEEYNTMISDERCFPVMRINNQDTCFLEEIINVYNFYFDELKVSLKQRAKTLHLAMAYFTQTIMRCPCLQKAEIGIIAATSFLLASKFDEIDYHLPNIK